MAQDRTRKPDAPAPQQAEADKQEVIRESYAHATATLRENHLSEFNDLRVAYTKAQGVEWTPKLTEEEKAEKQLRELLDAHPSLASVADDYRTDAEGPEEPVLVHPDNQPGDSQVTPPA